MLTDSTARYSTFVRPHANIFHKTETAPGIPVIRCRRGSADTRRVHRPALKSRWLALNCPLGYLPGFFLAFSLPFSLGFALTPSLGYAAEFAPGLSGDPDLRSASVLILDERGKVVYAKDERSVRPIASLTKLMTAIVVLSSEQDMDEVLTITKADRDLVQLTGSRLEFGARLTRGELLQLALMASENRAAAALGRNYPGGTAAFVSAMNDKAAELGMHDSHFADPAGLMVENTSTANDLALMLSAAAHFPQIGQASTTTRKQVYPYERRGPLIYGNTNRLLQNAAWHIALSKTGYINEAGRCLVMKATVDDQELSIVLLNSFGKLTPFGDSNRVRRWLQANTARQS